MKRDNLHDLKHQRGEPGRRYAGRLKALAAVCEYSVTCESCKTQTSYTFLMVKYQLVAGLASDEIKKMVLSHKNINNLALDEVIAYVEGEEDGAASPGLLSSGTVNEVSKSDLKKNKDSSKKYDQKSGKQSGNFSGGVETILEEKTTAKQLEILY